MISFRKPGNRRVRFLWLVWESPAVWRRAGFDSFPVGVHEIVGKSLV